MVLLFGWKSQREKFNFTVMSWHHINTRRISLQMCLFWNDGFNKKHRATYGIGVSNFLNFFNGRKTEYHVDAGEWEDYRRGQNALLDRRVFVRTLPWEAQEYLEQQLGRRQASFPQDLSALSDGELLALQRRTAEEVAWTNSRTWMIYLINDLIAERVREHLRGRVSDRAKADEYLLNFSTPLEPNDAMKERMALLDARQYEHIPMFGFDHTPYVLSDFVRMLEEISGGEGELRQLTETMANRKVLFERHLEELGLAETDELFDLIRLLKHTVFVRDYRDTLRQKMYLLDRYMYEEMGRRLGNLTAEEATNLTSEEIADGLNGGDRAKFRLLAEERKKGFLVIERSGHLEVFSGDEAHSAARRELALPGTASDRVIRGVGASRGRAAGPARLIETNQELGKIRSGDVMITHVTRQDFVPAMRRCVAIVTDEGGITNHAAIIAREFGLPCVVGAKGALAEFKDGEEVEVDADAGTVERRH
ncbi:MAG: Phosphoenolpyruvate synthase/pyruvate phosphate dikinase [Candidatus Magasanikbacteria bacterium GW2011_GWA2_56_11]|uniref:Phosphoenolpyruvate synthase/pyruvate phosphate dikinase n=1 Tax=Candidatus Magasanikbacteria bacterium GW2011_GWA2_56_11 TaxID=1619044 RepID=A0A0G1YEM0_9BACT|nr:MAG: Phosphoenolpyruvate synthase/pyruvate phosphate dikinase [Candidatus Magasanikbacteria bacterium GW2011_GWA2_56_11]